MTWHRRFSMNFYFYFIELSVQCALQSQVNTITSTRNHFHSKSLPPYLCLCASLVLQPISGNRFFPWNNIYRWNGNWVLNWAHFWDFFYSLVAFQYFSCWYTSLLSDMTVLIWKWHLDGRNWCTQAFNIKIRQIVRKWTAK